MIHTHPPHIHLWVELLSANLHFSLWDEGGSKKVKTGFKSQVYEKLPS